MSMYKYPSLDSMWTDMVRLTVSANATSSRDGDAREIIGFTGELIDPSMCWLSNPIRNASPRYAAAEVLWYLSGEDRVDMMTVYAPQYARFAESSGKAHGAYGPRIGKQLEQLIRALKKDPSTRRAVVGLWRESDLADGMMVKDVPCTLTWSFYARGGRLYMKADMRSNDVWLGVPYDVFWNCTAMHIIADELGLGLGSYFHTVGSLHLYERNSNRARTALMHYYDKAPPAPWATESLSDLHSVRAAADVERSLRLNRSIEHEDYGKLCPVGKTLVALCARHLMSRGLPYEELSPGMATADAAFLERKTKRS